MCVSLGEDEPLPAVDWFTCRVEVPGVPYGLDHHVQDDLPQIIHPPPAEALAGRQAGPASCQASSGPCSTASMTGGPKTFLA